MTDLISKHGGYRDLKSFQMAEIVFDLTNEFCAKYIDKSYKSNKTYYNPNRQADQMLQAVRSGKQNIAEASATSGTSKQSEIRLLDVARASFEELLQDYLDFLRQNNLAVWQKNDPRVLAIRKLAYVSNRTYKSYMSYMSNAEIAANCILCVINQANFLLDKQMQVLNKNLVERGDFKDRYKQIRKQQMFDVSDDYDEFLKQFNLKKLENGQVVKVDNKE